MIIQKDKPFYNITQVSDILEMSTDRLRTYDEDKLVFPFRRKKDKKRLYSESDIEWIQNIRFIISKNKMNIYSFKMVLKFINEISDKKILEMFEDELDDNVILTLIEMKKNPNFIKIVDNFDR